MRTMYWMILMMPLFLLACKEKQKSTSIPKEKQEGVATYFSITNYFEDQWNIRKGNPYTLLRIITLNGKADSAYVHLDSTLWFGLRAKFDAADISDPKFLGQYYFDMFDDKTLSTTYLHYEAKSPDLFMQKMNIGADMFTNLVNSVYIETRTGKGNHIRTQKLQYRPDYIFQIQEYEKSPGAPEKDLRMEYRFEY